MKIIASSIKQEEKVFLHAGYLSAAPVVEEKNEENRVDENDG